MELSERYLKQLEDEGFAHVYEWFDEPGTVYPAHAHKDKVTLFVTDGEIEMDIDGEKKLLKIGDRYNVPPGVTHTGIVGSDGCKFVVGEMIDGDS